MVRFEYKNLEEAIKHAYESNESVYLYEDKVIVKEECEEDCYLSNTPIIDSNAVNSYEEFHDLVAGYALPTLCKMISE